MESTAARLLLRSALVADYAAIMQVETSAFGRRDEAQLVERLRADSDIIFEFVAVAGPEVIGHAVLSRMQIERENDTTDALALAPIAVLPPWQRHGVGSGLIKTAVRLASAAGERAIIVLGHEAYYPKLGFSAEAAAGLEHPFEHKSAFMAMKLKAADAATLCGRVKYPKAFGLAPEWTK